MCVKVRINNIKDMYLNTMIINTYFNTVNRNNNFKGLDVKVQAFYLLKI